MMKAILTLMPLDPAVKAPCELMQMMPQHVAAGWKTPIWEEYKQIAAAAEGKEVEFQEVERFRFYEEARKAYCIVATGEGALYANVILRKGVIGKSD